MQWAPEINIKIVDTFMEIHVRTFIKSFIGSKHHIGGQKDVQIHNQKITFSSAKLWEVIFFWTVGWTNDQTVGLSGLQISAMATMQRIGTGPLQETCACSIWPGPSSHCLFQQPET